MLLRIFRVGIQTTILQTNSVVIPTRRRYVKSSNTIFLLNSDFCDTSVCRPRSSSRSFAFSSSRRTLNSFVMSDTASTIVGTGIIPTVKCVPCSSLDTSHKVDIDTLRTRVPIELPLWSLVPKNEDNTNEVYHILSRSFTAKNFQCALDSINAMGVIAEEQGHHPDFHLTNYRDVEIVLYTHTVNGITENDISLAKLLDSTIKIEYSPKWLSVHPEATATNKT
jgi:pterin-4a-carbinolamine dehydratase